MEPAHSHLAEPPPHGQVAGNYIGIQGDRAIPRQHPAFHIHARGYGDGCEGIAHFAVFYSRTAPRQFAANESGGNQSLVSSSDQPDLSPSLIIESGRISILRSPLWLSEVQTRKEKSISIPMPFFQRSVRAEI